MKTIVNKVEVGDRDEAGAIAGISGATFANYSRTRRPKHNPAPEPVGRDLATGRYLYPLDEVREWSLSLPGSGRWGEYR